MYKSIFSSNEQVIIFSNEEDRTRYCTPTQLKPKALPAFLIWTDLPSKDISDSKIVRIWDPERRHTELPVALSHFKEINLLEIPMHLVKNLDGGIRENCLELNVNAHKDEKLPDRIVFENVVCLTTMYAGSVLFSASSFPSLHNAAVKIDKNEKLLDVLSGMKTIQCLSVSPCRKDQGIFHKLSSLNLDYLQLNNGYLDSLEGIEKLCNLHGLRLQNLPKLHSIKNLTALKNLTELMIAYCTKIEDVEAVLELKNLQKLNFVACGDLGLRKIKEQISKMNLKEIGYGGTR